MKLLFLSDLHADNLYVTKGINIYPNLVKHIQKYKPDVIVISGDISGDYKTTLNFIKKLENELNIFVYFIPGNHDIWTEKSNEYPNASLKALQELQAVENCIENRIIHLNDETALIGCMGWYDYSFALPKLDDFVMKSRKKQFSDHQYVNWKYSDKEFFDIQINNLNNLLNSEELRNKNVLVSMHYVPFSYFIHYSNLNDDWNIVNGFFGGYDLGKTILKYKNVKLVHFGHTHKHKVDSYGDLQLVCKPFGYHFEWAVDDIDKQLELSSFLYEI